MKKGKLKQNKAITLVALVITIIILLILATVTIVELKNTKLFNKTIEARNKYKQSAEEENNTLDDYANKINEIAGGTSKNNATKTTKISSTDGSKTIEISGNKVTVTESGTPTTVTIDKTKDPTEYDTATKNVLSKIYGTEVEYTGNTDINAKTWRIFYIDFANKYGDGEGTIYLKADWTVNDTRLNGQSSYTPSNTDKTILKNMNKKWYETRSTATWNENEHTAAWLCSPSQWTKYKNSSATYAIGGPSVEMYCDSYNSVNHTTGNYKITFQYQASVASGYKSPGYGYLVNGYTGCYGAHTDNNTVDYIGYNSMYCGSNKTKGDYYWWMASPVSRGSEYVCIVSGYDAYLTSFMDGNEFGICPLVSLSSSVQLNIR